METSSQCSRRQGRARGGVEMKFPSSNSRAANGIMLIECLVYTVVLLILLGVAYAAFYRCMENSVALRRNAEDITTALQAGERRRAGVGGGVGAVDRKRGGEGKRGDVGGGRIIKKKKKRGQRENKQKEGHERNNRTEVRRRRLGSKRKGRGKGKRVDLGVRSIIELQR